MEPGIALAVALALPIIPPPATLPAAVSRPPVVVGATPQGTSGFYSFSTGTIVVKPGLSALKHRSVVDHETGHHLQHRKHGSLEGVLAHLGTGGAEREADCVGVILAAGGPYVSSSYGCTNAYMASARALVEGR